MQCSSLMLFCFRTQGGGENIWALEHLSKFRSLGVLSCHNALMSSAHKVSAAGCFSSSLLGGGRGVCVRAKAAEAKPSSSKAGTGQELED